MYSSRQCTRSDQNTAKLIEHDRQLPIKKGLQQTCQHTFRWQGSHAVFRMHMHGCRTFPSLLPALPVT